MKWKGQKNRASNSAVGKPFETIRQSYIKPTIKGELRESSKTKGLIEAITKYEGIGFETVGANKKPVGFFRDQHHFGAAHPHRGAIASFLVVRFLPFFQIVIGRILKESGKEN